MRDIRLHFSPGTPRREVGPDSPFICGILPGANRRPDPETPPVRRAPTNSTSASTPRRHRRFRPASSREDRGGCLYLITCCGSLSRYKAKFPCNSRVQAKDYAGRDCIGPASIPVSRTCFGAHPCLVQPHQTRAAKTHRFRKWSDPAGGPIEPVNVIVHVQTAGGFAGTTLTFGSSLKLGLDDAYDRNGNPGRPGWSAPPPHVRRTRLAGPLLVLRTRWPLRRERPRERASPVQRHETTFGGRVLGTDLPSFDFMGAPAH